MGMSIYNYIADGVVASTTQARRLGYDIGDDLDDLGDDSVHAIFSDGASAAVVSGTASELRAMLQSMIDDIDTLNPADPAYEKVNAPTIPRCKPVNVRDVAKANGYDVSMFSDREIARAIAVAAAQHRWTEYDPSSREEITRNIVPVSLAALWELKHSL